MDNKDVPSILMCVGKQYYKLSEFVDEAERDGISKRIPTTNIPQGLVPYVSKIFVAHPDSIIRTKAEGKTLSELASRLLEIGTLPYLSFIDIPEIYSPYWQNEKILSYEFVPACILDLALALDRCEDKVRDKLIEEFGIEFCMGIFGYSYIQSLVYIAKEGEEELPEKLVDQEGYVQPIHVVHLKDEE